MILQRWTNKKTFWGLRRAFALSLSRRSLSKSFNSRSPQDVWAFKVIFTLFFPRLLWNKFFHFPPLWRHAMSHKPRCDLFALIFFVLWHLPAIKALAFELELHRLSLILRKRSLAWEIGSSLPSHFVSYDFSIMPKFTAWGRNSFPSMQYAPKAKKKEKRGRDENIMCLHVSLL